jgi:hypothetical protein
MVPVMRVSVLGRQIATFVIALGLLLNAMTPACAMPTKPTHADPVITAAMPGMAMDQDCMDMGKSMPEKQRPGKPHDNSRALCTSCIVMVGLVPDVIATPSPAQHGFGVSGTDANPDGIASPPALPPPISFV